ncbi:MAG: hypothetical protein AB1420_18880 [Bacillota bacterium]
MKTIKVLIVMLVLFLGLPSVTLANDILNDIGSCHTSYSDEWTEWSPSWGIKKFYFRIYIYEVWEVDYQSIANFRHEVFIYIPEAKRFEPSITQTGYFSYTRHFVNNNRVATYYPSAYSSSPEMSYWLGSRDKAIFHSACLSYIYFTIDDSARAQVRCGWEANDFSPRPYDMSLTYY